MKKYLLIALFAMMPCFALAQGTTVSQSIVITNSLGRPLGGVKVEICTTVSASSPACAGAASIFSDSGLSVPIACSASTCLTTDSLGQVPIFFASPGTYCYGVSGAYITDTSCHLIVLYAATGGTAVIFSPSGAQNVTQPSNTSLNANRFEAVRYVDQFTGATTALRITAACNDLSGANGLIVVPSTMSGTTIPALTAGCIVVDQRGDTGNGGILWSRQLSGTEQYGFAFATQSLASDGQSSTALLGEVAQGVAGTNVVGVRGQVYSAASAAVYGINFGSGGAGGPGVQGDSTNLPGAVGILGTGCATGGTLVNPCTAVKATATGNVTYNGSIPFVASGDNSTVGVFNSTAASGSAIDPQVVKVQSALNSNTSLSNVNTSVGGKRWDWKSTGASDSCTSSAGFLVFYDQTDNRCPFSIDSATTSNMFALTATGLKINGTSEMNTLKVDTSVSNDAGGIKHKRGTAGCTTGASIGASCTTVVTWTTTFADANYTTWCSGRLISSGVPVIGANTAQIAASVTITTVATTAAAAQFTAVDCVAFHD